MAYKSNRNRKGNQPIQREPDIKDLLYLILNRQSVLGRMLARSNRYGRLTLDLARTIQGMEKKEMFNVQRLVDAAKAQTDATVAMKAAMDKVLADLRDAQDDPEQLEAALTAFEANTAVIAAAATAGTPADTGGEVPPVVVTPGSQAGGDNQS